MEEATAIVRMLEGAPFHLDMTVVEYCQASGSFLNQLLYKVLSSILPSQKHESSFDSTTCWMMDALVTLNYKPAIDSDQKFHEGLASGNRDVIHQVLLWLLPQIHDLQQQSYLSHFLAEVEMPDEELFEEETGRVYMQYQAVREEFRTTHQELRNLRQMDKDPVKLKDQILELEADRDHLQAKVIKLKNKLKDVAKLEEMLEVVGELKTQKMEEKSLTDSLTEQRHILSTLSDKHQRAYMRVQKLNALSNNVDINVFLEKLSKENVSLQHKIENFLPQELTAKENHLKALHQVLDESNSSENLTNIQAQLIAVKEEVKKMKPRNGDVGKKDSSHTHVGAIVANMFRAANEKVQALSEWKEKLSRDLHHKNQMIAEVKATVLRGEELKNYVEALRAKSVVYKERKEEIAQLDSEYANLLEEYQALEQRSQAQPCQEKNTEDISKQKAAKNLKKMVDEVKVMTVEMQSQLAPQAKELKLLRASLQSLEIEQAEKKQHFSDLCSIFDKKALKLETELATSSKELEDATMQLKQNDIAILQLEELRLQLMTEMEDASVSEKLMEQVQQQAQALQELSVRLHKIKESEHIDHAQMAMMKDLLALVAAKLSLYSSPAIFSTSSASFETLHCQRESKPFGVLRM